METQLENLIANLIRQLENCGNHSVLTYAIEGRLIRFTKIEFDKIRMVTLPCYGVQNDRIV